jgi:hypothetical protein
MHRSAYVVPILLVSIAACAGTTKTAEGGASESAVPAGVVEQYTVLAEEVSDRGGSVTKNGWTVDYIVEAAEPWFERNESGAREFREPRADETHHLEIIPREESSGRIVPDVPITLEVIDADGTVVEKQKLNFYYSTFYHYANNFHVAKEGTYSLRASIGSPGFRRHGERTEPPALSKGVSVTFKNVEFTND